MPFRHWRRMALKYQKRNHIFKSKNVIELNTALSMQKRNRLPEFIFFGNYFYGICAVALSIEATLQQRFPLNSLAYFFLVFISTVLYYTYPYVRKCSFISTNARTNWYTRNYNLSRRTQTGITIILIVSLVFFFINYWQAILNMSTQQWLIVLIFPVVAAFYYGINLFSAKYNLRKIGWLKPFIIGFIWAGLVTVYPVLFYCIVKSRQFEVTTTGSLLFLKNFMFITLLCIMFDVKDYASDYINRLKTFVVKIGLRKTIFYILLPLTLLGLGSFIFYAGMHHFSLPKVLLNTIPFVVLAVTAFSLSRRRPIMYYLIVIDGLMLVKALCGTIAILYF